MAPLRTVRPADVRTATVTHVDDSRGLVALAAVAGQTLHERISDPAVTDSELALDLKRVGVAMRSLHSLPVRTALPTHGALREVGAARRWLQAATTHALIPAADWQAAVRVRSCAARRRSRRVRAGASRPARQAAGARRRRTGRAPGSRPRHSWPPGGGPREPAGAPGAPGAAGALHAGSAPPRRLGCAAGGLRARSPRRATPCSAYAASTRLRLAGVYAFRPATSGLVAHLLNSVTDTRQDVPR